MRKKPVTVTWELLVDDDGPKSIVVDVDAPLRPFGADPTPPRGTKALANLVDDQFDGDTDKVLLPADDTQEEPM